MQKLLSHCRGQGTQPDTICYHFSSRPSPILVATTQVENRWWDRQLYYLQKVQSLPLSESIGTSKKALKVILDQVSCIYYLVQFCQDKEIIQALINFGSEVNVMSLAYAKKLGLRTQIINVGAQKIDGLSLDTFGIVIIGFQVSDK